MPSFLHLAKWRNCNYVSSCILTYLGTSPASFRFSMRFFPILADTVKLIFHVECLGNSKDDLFILVSHKTLSFIVTNDKKKSIHSRTLKLKLDIYSIRKYILLFNWLALSSWVFDLILTSSFLHWTKWKIIIPSLSQMENINLSFLAPGNKYSWSW